MIVYGFFFNSCIYESADALISLHRTKRGAWRALRDHKIARYHSDRENSPFKMRGWTKEKPVSWERWSIYPVEILE